MVISMTIYCYGRSANARLSTDQSPYFVYLTWKILALGHKSEKLNRLPPKGIQRKLGDRPCMVIVCLLKKSSGNG